MNIETLQERWRADAERRGRCPRCDSDLVIFDGVRRRKATFLLEGRLHTAAEIPVRRCRCKACRARWARAPDHVPSRAHFQPCVVERAVAALEERPADSVEDVAAAHGCHRRTLRAWIDRVASSASAADLARALVAVADTPILPKIPTISLRPLSPAVLCQQLGQALGVLVLLDILAMHFGLEPPALARMDEFERLIPAFARRPPVRGDPISAT